MADELSEKVDRNLTPENQARIEATFQGLVSQHFDCHYNGEPSKCDKDCAQLGYCKRRTSEPAPVREPSAVEEVNAAAGRYDDYSTPDVVDRATALRHAEELDRLRAENDRLRQDRYDALSVFSKDGLLASEWVARTGKAEREVKTLRAENAALRESDAWRSAWRNLRRKK